MIFIYLNGLGLCVFDLCSSLLYIPNINLLFIYAAYFSF